MDLHFPKSIKFRKHNEPTDWLNVYYFENRHRRKEVLNNAYFRKHSLYYLSQNSKNDKLFDFYKIIKPKYDYYDEVAIEKKLKKKVIKEYVPYNNTLSEIDPLSVVF